MAFKTPIGQFYVALGIDTSKFRKNLRTAGWEIRRAFGSEAINYSNKLTYAFAGLTAGAAALGFKMAVMGAQFEQVTTAFTTLMKSSVKAKELLQDINQYAASTPFQFDNLARASRTLIAFGFSGKEILPTLARLGDVAAGSKQPIEDLALLFGKARISGRVMSRDLNQFLIRGIPLISEFAKQFGVAESQIRKMVRNGQIKFANLQQAMKDITTGAGLFTNATYAQSQTIVGLWTTVKDNVLIAMRDIGMKINDALSVRPAFKKIVKDLQWFNASVKLIGIRTTLNELIPPYIKVGFIVLAGAIVGIMVPALTLLAIKLLQISVPFARISLLISEAFIAITVLAGQWKSLWKNFVYDAKVFGYKALQSFYFLMEKVTYYLAKFSLTMADVFAGLGTKFDLFTKTAISSFHSLISSSKEFKQAVQTTDEKISNLTYLFSHPPKQYGTWIVSTIQQLTKLTTSLDYVSGRFNHFFLRIKKLMSPSQAAMFVKFWKALRGEGQESKGKDKTVGGATKDTPEVTRAKNTSSHIADLWIQLTKTKQEQNKYWYKNELEKLNASKISNVNYLRDLSRLQEVYSAKKLKLQKEESDKLKRENNKKIADKEKLGNKLFDIEAKKNASYAKLRQDLMFKFLKTIDNMRLGKDLERQEDEVRNSGSLADFNKTLSEKAIKFKQNIQDRKVIFDAFEKYKMQSHRSTTSKMLEAYSTLTDGIQGFFQGLITGGKSLGESIKQLGVQIINMFIKWKVQQVMSAAMQKALLASSTAASVTAAATTAAAWAPAAAAASVATLGQASAVGMAGLGTIGSILPSIFKMAIPFANGGVVTAPTLAMIGEGGKNEAVIPLDRLNTMLSGGKGNIQINVNNNSGVPVNAKASQHFDGVRAVVDLVIDGINHNVSGIQDIIGGNR